MSDRSATAQLYSARPEFAIDGEDSPDLAEGLLALAVHEDVSGLFSCEAVFGNWGTHSGAVEFLYFDRQVFDFGRELTITMGSGDRSAQVFQGRVSGLEGRFPQQRPPELLVMAEDRFQDLRMVRRTRSFENVTLDDLVSEITSDHGLQSDVDVDSPTFLTIAQVNQSDLAFLRERARAVDAEIWMDGDTLHAQARRRRRTAEVTLTYGQSLHECAFNADLTHQRTKLLVSGWDVSSREGIDEEADKSVLGAELEGLSGAELLESAFGAREDRLVHCVPQSTTEARSLAETEFKRLARSFVSGRAVAEGDARIRAGAKVTLRGLGPLFDGAFYVTDARHTFDATYGYRTHFSAERPWMGR